MGPIYRSLTKSMDFPARHIFPTLASASQWEVPAGSGLTLARSLKDWLASAMAGVVGGNRHVDQVPWPANSPCAKLGSLATALEA